MLGEAIESRVWRKLILLFAISSAARLAILYVVVPYGGVLPPTFPDLEPYQDYKYLYINDVNRFLSGSIPYRDFFYAYPPLLLYTLSLFALFHLPSWGSAIPIVAYDALTVIPIFLIARRLTNGKWASIVALAASLTPMVLWYNTALWLNPPPPTFFMLLSAYLMLTGRSRLAAFTLGLATGYKADFSGALPGHAHRLICGRFQKEGG